MSAPLGPSGRALLVAAALAVLPGAAAPQTAPPDSVVPLDSLTVTVLRTPIRLGRAPFAVSVLPEGDLQRGGAGVFLEETLEGLPGIQVQNRFNLAVGERVSIRGFGPRAQFGVRGIRVLVDGIPATLPDGQSTLDHLDFGSLGRAELLRGPASALYGNASGGVLALESRAPPRAPLGVEVGADVGSFGLRQLGATAGGRVSGHGYLVSAGHLWYEGFRSDPVGGGTYGEAERLTLNGYWTRPVAGGELRLVANGVDLEAENPGSLSDSLLAEGDRSAFRFNVLQGTGKTVRQGQVGATWNGPVGAGLRGSLAGYVTSRSVDNPIPSDVIDLDRVATGVRVSVDGAGPSELTGMEWTVGVEWDGQWDDRKNFVNDGGERGALTLDQDETVRSASAFGRVLLPLGARATALAGLRYDRIRFEVDDLLGDASGGRTMDAFTPSVGASLAVVPELDLYANVAGSFETPTTTELANRPTGAGGFNPDLEPQRGYTFEVGARGRVGTGLVYEATVYQTRITDDLVPFEVPDAPGRTFFRNAGRTRHRGAEATLRAVLRPRVTTRATWTWTEAEFLEYTPEGRDYAGNRVPGLAPWRLEGAVRWSPGPAWLELAGEYVDGVPVDDANTASADPYALFDARAGLTERRVLGFGLTPYVAVTNLLDRAYTTSVVVNAFGSRYFEPGPGRAVRVGASAWWGGE